MAGKGFVLILLILVAYIIGQRAYGKLMFKNKFQFLIYLGGSPRIEAFPDRTCQNWILTQLLGLLIYFYVKRIKDSQKYS